MRIRQRPLPNRCELRPCEAVAYRRCRLCRRWACRAHRTGAGQWWACLECPAEQLQPARDRWLAKVTKDNADEWAAELDEAARPAG